MVARLLTKEVARRLAIVRQRLAGPRPPADARGILEVVGEIGRLQLDPTSAVARSHLLVLWSRLGSYNPADLAHLLEVERALFEYRAFIVPTADYSLYRARMRTFPRGDSKRSRDTREWMEANDRLRRSVLLQLRRRGPLRLRDFQDRTVVGWRSSGWNDERNVGQMLDLLLAQGKVLVSRREGGQRLWDLTERVLPQVVLAQKPLRVEQAERLSAELELRRRGVAAPSELPWLPGALHPKALLERLAHDARALPVAVEDVPGERYVHTDDMPLIDRLEAGEWKPRTTLLSPFDALISDRDRTERLFGFRYRLELYVPQAKREYGYFVMPLLHGDRLIGRIDPAYDRRRRLLAIKAVHWEPDAPRDRRRALGSAVKELGRFLGAERIDYT